MKKTVKKHNRGLLGEIEIPADKSLSHRAVMFASIANGSSIIRNFSQGADCKSTISVCQSLGIDIQYLNDKTLQITSNGKLSAPEHALYCGNSGTTMRLMSGILAGQNFDSILTGDESLSKRPMKRIITPLTQMGANISSKEGLAPLNIKQSSLIGISYNSPLSSAQVKSCVLLAGMHADGETIFSEPTKSRDHTERMLKAMGANINITENSVKISRSKLSPIEFTIPGDISSAAFFIVAALIIPNSDIILKNVGVNPTRTGIIDVVKRMGGGIEILNFREELGEPIADIHVKYSTLQATEIFGAEIPRLIDEIPIITVLATQAEGKTVIRDASDLRHKEADRITTVTNALKKLGANIEETPDGFIIRGKTTLKGDCLLETFHDHRLAMTYYIAGLIAESPITINGFEWTVISFPEFENLMEQLFND